MSKNRSPAATIEEPQSKATKFVAFNAVKIYGEAANVTVKKENFILSTQIMLLLQSFLWKSAAEISIKKLIIVWCPLVEPGALSSIRLKVSYDMGDEIDDLNAEETVVHITGRISEFLRVVIHPTKPIVKPHDMAFYIPWTATAEADDSMDIHGKSALGILKLWCHLRIKTFFAINRSENKLYQAPDVSWSNTHYPYYVPFSLIKRVRGIGPILWRDTEQYKQFMKEIAVHVDSKLIPAKDHLPLMQTMSKDDVSTAIQTTTTCHTRDGGYCTCGDQLAKFLSSVLLNSTGKCRDHGKIYDTTAIDIMTGKVKTINGHPDVKF